MASITLPPDLAALARPAPAALTPATVRLDLATHAELEALRERLGGASRGALLRHLVQVGLAATRKQLAPEH